jgi:hypothetical protein
MVPDGAIVLEFQLESFTGMSRFYSHDAVMQLFSGIYTVSFLLEKCYLKIV